jgi:hypothetical protein
MVTFSNPHFIFPAISKTTKFDKKIQGILGVNDY